MKSVKPIACERVGGGGEGGECVSDISLVQDISDSKQIKNSKIVNIFMFMELQGFSLRPTNGVIITHNELLIA